jgi:hypothetical protein
MAGFEPAMDRRWLPEVIPSHRIELPDLADEIASQLADDTNRGR